MKSFEIIQNKLEDFIRKYYTDELLKGSILFIAMGLLYFLVTLLIEYFLWLNSAGRLVLFWLFIVVELLLFIRFIVYPLSKLFRFRKGINHEQAAGIIGNHFPEVSDKLLNVIQLSQNPEQSELLLAGIEQKSEELKPVHFSKAVNFKKNIKYFKYVAIPVLVFILFSLAGGTDIFSSSYNRVVNYEMAFEPPAPFYFEVLNDDLTAIENQSFELRVQTKGSVIPENIHIEYNGENYYMIPISPGYFQYTFSQPSNSMDFRLRANKIQSQPYRLSIIKAPAITGFEMILNYPDYLNRPAESLKSTGNAIVPEGTSVSWKIKTENTSEVHFYDRDSVFLFENQKNDFHFSKQVFQDLSYEITTSNNDLKQYEQLRFQVDVIKDEFPTISVESKTDSLDRQKRYHFGEVADDYGLTKLQIVYYPTSEPENKKSKNLPVSKSNFDQFLFVFPGSLELEDGKSYDYYFEVFDNDALHNFKSSKSSVFTFQKFTESERIAENLKNQQNAIRGLNKTLDDFRESKDILDEISRLQKEKNELNYNDKKKLEEFLKRQKQQEEMIKNFSDQLRDELEKFGEDHPDSDKKKEQLEERFEEQEKRLEENEKLLDELEKLQDKIKKEDLLDRLDKLARQNQNQERNLEQLLELTKRFYVEKKAEKLADELIQLGEKQEALSGEKDSSIEDQQKMEEAFEEFKKQMEELQKENEDLKNPFDLPRDPVMEQEIDLHQEDALDNLQQGQPEKAGKNQEDAGKKMQSMGQMMKQQMMAGDMETLSEDVKMLRKILDNLVVFSFSQEDLMEEFQTIHYGNPLYGSKLRVQNELKQNFTHIDDSLFALSLRVPLIGDQINSLLTDAHYNLDKSLERLSDNQKQLGLSNQRYIITGSNELAVLLDDLLSNMQMQLQMSMGAGSGQSMPSPGQHGDEKFQLSDIIIQQEELIDQMQQGMEQGQGDDSGDEDGSEGKSGEGTGQGEDSEGSGEQGEGSYSESMDGELFEIYKNQYLLREKLRQLIDKQRVGQHGQRLLKEMEIIEQQLLDRGFDSGTLQRMQNLQYKLLELEEATLEQGQDEKREAETNLRDFENTIREDYDRAREYFRTTEILNRDILPLTEIYRNRVKSYFRNEDD